MSPSNSPFVDYVRMSVKGGDGGDGCLSFRKEKHVPRGGPDGGDGGKGGDVWIETDPQLATLIDIRYRPDVRAGRGAHGRGKNMSGRMGEDRIIKVPLGTVVSDEDGPLVDMTEPGQRFLAGAGGDGGLGNQHFATPTQQVPRKATPGWEGQQRVLFLELKAIADVGLVGLPNAGKSTLLKRITHATPRIASYPFTTLHPNLGMMELPDYRRITIADIPGLIEGASKGVGLGDRFLRHIERTGLLVHLIAPDETALADGDPDDDTIELIARMAADAHELVRMELQTYSVELGRKVEIVVLSKIDLVPPEARGKLLDVLKSLGIEALPISSESEEGIEDLCKALDEKIDWIRPFGGTETPSAAMENDA